MTTTPTKQLSFQSIRAAALELSRWRGANDSQGAMHMVHLLAAKLAGAKPGVSIPYTERNVDFVFCDRFLRVNNSDHPYFDPFDMDHRISTHPHSNVATSRKKTFSDKWRAGRFSGEGDATTFELKADYVSILVGKMAKAGHYTKLSPEALACWLYREHSFPVDSQLPNVVDQFREEFNFVDDEWQALFALPTRDTTHRFNRWVLAPDPGANHTIIDVLTRDVEGFNLLRSLTAIREVYNVPILTPQQITTTLNSMGVRQAVIQGPPGTGKTYLAKQAAEVIIGAPLHGLRSKLASSENGGRWGIVQFHPSYGYEDFIQRMVPKQNATGGVVVDIVDMPFLVACQIALKIAPDPFVLIIDEMNRADLQNVFGELMYALEYRNEPVTIKYSHGDLVVPENLYLIGTMNTADSSVVQVDYAIRRRFVFLDAPPDRQVIESVVSDEKTKKAALALLIATNAACNNHPRFSIGHSYFLKQDIPSLLNGFVYQVLPVLRSYQDNGVIPEDAAVHLAGWTGDPITPHCQRPDVLLESLSEWAADL